MTNIEKLVALLAAPAQALEAAFQQLLTLRSIFTATNQQLDDIGKIVGQPRGGLGDDDYRRYLFARVATNRSAGKRDELLNIARLILNSTEGQILIRCVGDASFILEVRGIAVTDALGAILLSFLDAATAAGVRIVVEYSDVATSGTLRFDVGPGLDVGRLARGIDAST